MTSTKRNTTRKRVLLVSGAIILLCMIIIAGTTVALFTDQKSMSNHLRAGDLEVTLTRTNLEYSVLNQQGKLEVITNAQPASFTNSTGENVFGVDATNLRIVPGSYFKAQMQVANVGNVAFTYNVGIQMSQQANALAEQLEITITRADGTSVTAMLSEIGQTTISAGEMLVGDQPQTFTVEVRFIDNTNINDLAQNQLAVFDLYVTAVQSTGNP